MSRYGGYVLLVLVLLIVLSPCAWWLGLPLAKVLAADAFWGTLWLVAAAIGRKYGG